MAHGPTDREPCTTVPPLRSVSEPLNGFDADDGRDRCDLETAPGVTEVLLDGVHIEPAADLLRTGDGELLTGYGQEFAVLELALQRLAFGFGALEDGVRLADRVGKRFVGDIVESLLRVLAA